MILINFKRFFLPIIGLFVCALCIISCGNSQDAAQPAEVQKAPAPGDKVNLTVEQLGDMIKKEPKNHELYYERALAYCEMNDYGAALKDFDKTIELDPNFTSAYHDRGICKYQLVMLDEAIKDFSTAIEMDDQYAEAYFNRSLAYSEKKEDKKALQDLNAAIEINPEFGDAYYNRAVYMLNTDREKSCADFKKAADLGIEEAAVTMEQYCK